MQEAATRNIRAFKTKSLDISFDLDNSEYKAVQNIGTGAYGVVCSAVHKKTSEKVAIKKIPNAFDELTTAKRTHRELKIMRHFRHENVIGIREILMPRESLSDFKDVYVVLDLMESDLHHIIHSQQSVSMEHIRYFLYQILRGLKYIHSANVVHRDLKPSNLLVNENCELKIGDFGMARGISGNADSKRKMFMTVYVATRWYRAPELLFSNEDYSYAVDMWSVGCIFAEMVGRRQIFPGKNPMHQLTLIIEVLGMPPDKLLQSTNSDQIFNFFHRNFGGKQSISLQEKYPQLDKNGLDLLSRMLIFSPEDRITVQDALSHPFLAKYHDPDDEPDCYPPFDFSFEQDNLSKQQIRQNVGKMILKYQKNKLFAGKKFPGSLSIAKPSTSVAAATNAAQESKSAIVKLTSTSTACSNAVLPMANFGQPNNSQDQGINHTQQEAIFKVPSLPADEKKTACSSGEQEINMKPVEETSLSVTAVRMLAVTNDVHMKSATTCSSTEISSLSNKEENVDHTATLSLSNSRDVEMKSARGEQKQLLTPCVAPASSESHDVDMKSARQQDETSEVVDDNRGSPAKDTPGRLVAGTEGTGPKTISDDTKKLIKAALLQSALKNKMKRDSEPERAGGKMPVTALTRQREREQKRRQKLRRSLERQKKGKGKSKKGTQVEKDDSVQLLTDEDRSMLERWSKMQNKKKEKTNTVEVELDTSQDSVTSETKPEKSSKKQPLPTRNHNGSSLAQKQSSQSSLNESGDILSSITNVSQKPETSQVPTDQNRQASICSLQQTSKADFKQDTLTRFSSVLQSVQFPFPATSKSHQDSYIGTIKMAPDMISTRLYFSQPNSEILGNGLNSVTYTGSNKNSLDFARNTPGKASNLPQQPSVESPAHNVPLSNIDSTTHFFGLYSPPASLATSSEVDQLQNHSDFQQYRSRHYSDRETPSPPHGIQPSPPAYDDSTRVKATSFTSPTGDTQSCSYTHNSHHHLNPTKSDPTHLPSQPHAQAAPSPPELAQVIRQLSKSAVEDILPPILQITPRGDGTGYGLALDLEDWLESSLGSPLTASKLDSGPLSASLLSDWLEVRNMNMDDMMAVQQELGLTSPFNLSDLPGLVESPKNKDRV